ncbi:MAG TPA: hypothetical protein VGS21_00245 [Acidimicrobiales bacterium]|nr:hypothetical protein [Acidimicrobiales bacterium]
MQLAVDTWLVVVVTPPPEVVVDPDPPVVVVPDPPLEVVPGPPVVPEVVPELLVPAPPHAVSIRTAAIAAIHPNLRPAVRMSYPRQPE